MLPPPTFRDYFRTVTLALRVRFLPECLDAFLSSREPDEAIIARGGAFLIDNLALALSIRLQGN